MSTDLPSVLRVQTEPGMYFDDAQVHELLTRRPSEYLSFNRKGLTDIACGVTTIELPPKQVF